MSVLALVTGASGFVGSHLVETLLKRGYEVRCLVRRTSNLRWIKELPVTFVEGDVSDVSSLDAAVSGVDYIFHSAGVIKANTLEAYLQANRFGTLNLLHAAKRHSGSLKRFVAVSSLAASGPADGRADSSEYQILPNERRLIKAVHEQSPARPVSWYGYSKWKGEDEVRKAKEELPITIIRPPVVYGARDEGVLEFFKIAKAGIVPSLGRSHCYSIIYVGDLVQGMIQAAESSRACGETYFLSNAYPLELAEIVQKMANALSSKIKARVRVPLPLLFAVAACIESLAKFTGKSTFISRQKIHEIGQEHWVCTSAKATDHFGYKPQMDDDEGFRQTGRWYADNGII